MTAKVSWAERSARASAAAAKRRQAAADELAELLAAPAPTTPIDEARHVLRLMHLREQAAAETSAKNNHPARPGHGWRAKGLQG